MKHTLDRIDLYTRHQGPGMIYAVLREDQVIEIKSGGYADLSNSTPIDANTIFNIASNTKAFTAASLIFLERENLLGLDDFAIDYIPELPAYACLIQIKHLVYHASGLASYHPLWNSPTPIESKDVIAFLIQENRLNFPAGSRIEYSNTGYVLLAEIIQRIHGKDFPDIVRKTIFQPLGMNDSSVLSSKDHRTISRRAVGYDPWPHFDINNLSRADFVYGDGGILTSINDYMKWTKALSSPGLFSADEIQRLFSPGIAATGLPWEYTATGGGFSVDEVRFIFTEGKKLEDGPVTYGYGWILAQLEGLPFASHGGRWCGFRSVVAYFPTSRIWILVFSNYAGTQRENVLSDLMEKYWSILQET